VIAVCSRCDATINYGTDSDLLDGHRCPDGGSPLERNWPGGPSPSDPVEMDLYRCRKDGHDGVIVCLRCSEILGEADPA
jgi:hypothetical protein